MQQEEIAVEENARYHSLPAVTYHHFYNLLILSVSISVKDCDPGIPECAMIKYYKTHIKIKFLCFVLDTHIKSKYKPLLNTYFECNWLTNIRSILRKFYNYLDSRFHRKKYASKKDQDHFY